MNFTHVRFSRLNCLTITLGVILIYLVKKLLQSEAFKSDSCVLSSNRTISQLRAIKPISDSDYHRLMDLSNFEFTLNIPACRTHHPIVVGIVYSAPNNFQHRKVIRETWGTEDPRALVIFLLAAVGPGDFHLQDKIANEHNAYGDIVQCNFIDDYRNLTYKHVAALKWFAYHCPGARFMFKTDDDVMVNTPLMYNYLEVPLASNRKLHRKKLIFGHMMTCSKVQRSGRSKWRVTYEEYEYEYFPNYCLGVFVLYSADIVRHVYQVAQTLPFFWIEDVHITGTVSNKLGVAITNAEDFYLSEANQKYLLNGYDQTKVPPFFFSQPEMRESEIRSLWKIVRSGDSTAGLM